MVLNRDLSRPSRVLVAMLILLGLSIFINYVDRGNLGTAASLIKNEFHLSATQHGFLLTAMFITYVPMQPVVGWLVDSFGGGPILVSGFLLWSLATVLSGFAAAVVAISGGLAWIFLVGRVERIDWNARAVAPVAVPAT